MPDTEKPIWEQRGIPIEEYARSFNEELAAAAERVGIKQRQINEDDNGSKYIISW